MSTVRTWPSRIFLQRAEGEPFNEAHEVTWCQDRVHETDVEYVRVDLFNSLRAQLKRRSDDSTAEPTK